MPRKVIAVVDDDPGMLKALARLLGAHGFDSETFASAEAFLARASESAAACVLLDIQMGGMSGIELRRRLATTGCRLPVIFMTAFEDEATHKEAMAAGCTGYLLKPFSAKLLMGAIAAAAA